MTELNKLLDKIKESRSLASDNALAGLLGVTRGSVSNWRHGKNYPDTVQCAAIAGFTGEPLARVLGIVGEARAINREEKQVWRRLAASAAAVVIVLAGLLPVGAAQAQTRGIAITSQKTASNAYYVRAGRAFLTLASDVFLWLRWKFSGKVTAPHIEALSA